MPCSVVKRHIRTNEVQCRSFVKEMASNEEFIEIHVKIHQRVTLTSMGSVSMTRVVSMSLVVIIEVGVGCFSKLVVHCITIAALQFTQMILAISVVLVPGIHLFFKVGKC